MGGKTDHQKNSEETDDDGQSPRTSALSFLTRFSEQSRATEVLQNALKNWSRLQDAEAAWLSDRVPFFHQEALKRPAMGKPPITVPVPASDPVFDACRKGDQAVLRKFLKDGGSIYSREDLGMAPEDPHQNRTGDCLSVLAAKAGQIPVLKLLREHGLELNRPPYYFGDPLLRYAHEKKQDTVVEYLLQQGVPVRLKEQNGSSFFRRLCQEGNDLKLIEALIRQGADVEDEGERKDTLLMELARSGKAAAIKLLIQGGADPEKRNEDQKTALEYAIEADQIDTIITLLEMGADIEARGPNKRTPLLKAIESNRPKAVSVLVAKGADIYAKNSRGMCAWFFAEDRPTHPMSLPILKQYKENEKWNASIATAEQEAAATAKKSAKGKGRGKTKS